MVATCPERPSEGRSEMPRTGKPGKLPGGGDTWTIQFWRREVKSQAEKL